MVFADWVSKSGITENLKKVIVSNHLINVERLRQVFKEKEVEVEVEDCIDSNVVIETSFTDT